MWNNIAELLKQGETVKFRPKGNSMEPLIKSGQLVTVSPNLNPEIGDVVFCKVKGRYYLHLVKAIKLGKLYNTYLIGNNKGYINGWSKNIYGKVINIE